MTRQQAEWAAEHDWFHSAELSNVAPGEWCVWVKENDGIHPWPFRDYVELRRWAGY